ncbi:MAG: hypoxanthine phosphoribosyltransferase [Defluviitaleaceae bacterium]|nr:hypoxanthine phosphoribosyltransferase [Defluviitaleaceae bacterium]
MTQEDKKEQIIPLKTAEEIETRVSELAAQINKDYEGKTILLLGCLKGAYIFMADLSRKITVPTEIDHLKVSSYGDSTSPISQVAFDHRPSMSLSGRHVLLVEDIVDTGHTLAYLRRYLAEQNPASVGVCTLLDKPSRREAELPECEYTGFKIPDKFVVGYGLDYAQRYRNLPFIGEVIFG